MTRLSVNINKIATLRNSRGGNVPNVLEWAQKCEEFGAEGITVHPRPDKRHIRYADVYELKDNIHTELNIEGYPSEAFLQLVLSVKPGQVTLVPDSENVITSNAGWDTRSHFDFLTAIVKRLQEVSIRVSLFTGTEIPVIEYAEKAGADRIELYTEPYANRFPKNPQQAVEEFITAAEKARELGLGINAGHDLNLDNLRYLKEQIPFLDEVSIGHALIADALLLGMENTIQLYKRALR